MAYSNPTHKSVAFDDTAAVSLSLTGQARKLTIVAKGTDAYVNVAGGVASASNGFYLPTNAILEVEVMHPSSISVIAATATSSGTLYVIENN